MAATANFSGFKWPGIPTFPENSWLHRNGQSFLKSVDWEALCLSASSYHDGKTCTIEPDIGLGGGHMVRILKFQDGSRWIARLRMHLGVNTDGESTEDKETVDSAMQREVDCLRLVKERTSVPVPAVFAWIPSSSPENKIGASVILMEYIPGNVGMDLNFDTIPSEYKSPFFEEMAKIQTEISSITFPKIGSIIRLEDGSYDVGPIPGVGGPFETATEYFKAWAATSKFPQSESIITESCGDLAEKNISSTKKFPDNIVKLASQLCIQDRGPFSLFHVDFGHNNIVVDDSYKVLGVIDWEGAFSAPWEIVDFPSTFNMTPKAMDAPWNYDEYGVPKDEESRVRLVERTDYIAAVCWAESSGSNSSMLSKVLNEKRVQDLAPAMRLYVGGKIGFYSDILELHYPKQDSEKES